MNTADKEQHTKKPISEKEKKARVRAALVFVVLGILIVAMLYLADHHPAFTGTPFTVTAGGCTIKPGETTVQELADAGFTFTNFNSLKTPVFNGKTVGGAPDSLSLSENVKAKSYYDLIQLRKDGELYATLSVVNESSSSKTLADCKIRSISVYSSYEDAGNSSVAGIPMDQLSVETLKAAAGEPESSRDDNLSDEKKVVTIWKNIRYSMELSVSEDGSVYSFTSKYSKK